MSEINLNFHLLVSRKIRAAENFNIWFEVTFFFQFRGWFALYVFMDSSLVKSFENVRPQRFKDCLAFGLVPRSGDAHYQRFKD